MHVQMSQIKFNGSEFVFQVLMDNQPVFEIKKINLHQYFGVEVAVGSTQFTSQPGVIRNILIQGKNFDFLPSQVYLSIQCVIKLPDRWFK